MPETTTLLLDGAFTLTTSNTRQILERVAIGIDVTTEGGVNQIQKSVPVSGNFTVTGIAVGFVLITDDNVSISVIITKGSSTITVVANRLLVFMSAVTSIEIENTDSTNAHVVRLIYC